MNKPQFQFSAKAISLNLAILLLPPLILYIDHKAYHFKDPVTTSMHDVDILRVVVALGLHFLPSIILLSFIKARLNKIILIVLLSIMALPIFWILGIVIGCYGNGPCL